MTLGRVYNNNWNYVFQKNNFNCTRRYQCPGANVSSIQIQGDADFFINHLGVPTVEFAYDDIRALEVIVSKHPTDTTPIHSLTHSQYTTCTEFDFCLGYSSFIPNRSLEKVALRVILVQRFCNAIWKHQLFSIVNSIWKDLYCHSHFHSVFCSKIFAVVGLTSKRNCNLQYSQN